MPVPRVYLSAPVRVLFVFREPNFKNKPKDWDMREQVRELAERGTPNRWWDKMQENPAYATYRVIEYLEKNVTSHVYRQIGTLKDIADVAAGTILKSLVTLRAIEHQKVKLAAFTALEQLGEPGLIEQAKEIWAGKGRKPIDPPDQKKQKLVTYYENGRLRGKWVSPYIADSLNNESVAVNSVVLEALKAANGRWFRPVFVLFNTGFQTWNVQRDFWRMWKNTPHLTVAQAVKRYKQALPVARVRAFGLPAQPSPKQLEAAQFVREAEEARALTVTMNDLIAGRTVEDTEIEDIFARMGILERAAERPRRLLKPSVRFNLSGSPALSTCGDGALATGSSNTSGRVTGTTQTACTLTFSTTFAGNSTDCFIENLTANRGNVSAASSTAFTVSSLTAGDDFSYLCVGR